MPKTCMVCGKRAYSDYCFRCKPRKTIAQRGKYALKWSDYRREWLKKHTDLVFTCGICGKPVQREVVTLDHIKPRSGNPELRYDDSNIQPACYLCNIKKGSSRNTTKYDTM